MSWSHQFFKKTPPQIAGTYSSQFDSLAITRGRMGIGGISNCATKGWSRSSPTGMKRYLFPPPGRLSAFARVTTIEAAA